MCLINNIWKFKVSMRNHWVLARERPLYKKSEEYFNKLARLINCGEACEDEINWILSNENIR